MLTVDYTFILRLFFLSLGLGAVQLDLVAQPKGKPAPIKAPSQATSKKRGGPLVGSGGGKKANRFPRLDTLPEWLIKPSLEPGFWSGTQTLSLSTEKDGLSIYYTLDGRVPERSSAERYTQALSLSKTTVVRCRAYDAQGQGGREYSFTYLFGEDKTKFPVISIAIEPSLFFHPSTGVMQRGPGAAKAFPHRGANYYSTREFVAHIEFFETDRSRAFAGNIGLSLFGGTSRVFAQKSLALYARDEYGLKKIKHEVFPHLPLKSYKRLVLRNSGSDFGETHFRDAFITSIGKDCGLEVQAYRPCLVFINGQYWGIYNIREKLTKHFFEAHFGYHRDSLDIIEHMKDVKAGKRRHYDQMQTYMKEKDLSSQAHFDSIARMMDTDNFMDYQIMQIYMDNQDAGGNIKFWRPQVPGGRWRWVLFDTDYGFAHYNKKSYSFNSLIFHTKADGPNWPNPPWTTFNLRMLLKNKGFKDRFIRRFTDRINRDFEPSRVLARIDSFADRIYPELPRHWERWELTESRWRLEVEAMKTFTRERPRYMRQFIREMYPYVGPEVKFSLGIEGAGEVEVNEAYWLSDTFNGVYFKNIPLEFKAKPRLGFVFSHWELPNGKQVDSLYIKLPLQEGQNSLRAVFKPGRHPFADRAIINEISCRDTASGDWIELYNHSNQALNLQNWRLQDAQGQYFVFPEVQLAPKGFLIICQDLERFERVYGDSLPAIGNLGFGLDKRRETLQLFDPQGFPVDSMGYNITKEQAKGLYYLALRNYNADNGNFEQWQILNQNPSPAALNSGQGGVLQSLELPANPHTAFYVKASLACIAALVGLSWMYRRWTRKSSRR